MAHPQAIREKALALYRLGLGARRISKKLNLPIRTILNWAKKANIIRPALVACPIKMQRKIIQLYKTGLSMAKVAAKLNIDAVTVCKYIRRTGISRSKGLSKEKNNNWKGGITPENELLRHSPRYKNWRQKVFERDSWTCASCGQIGGTLRAHHILMWSKYFWMRFEMKNGITLCKPCHQRLHNKTKKIA